MPDDKGMERKQYSDERLDELLAQWAEAEIEPPAHFHAATMERLQQEALQKPKQKKQGKVISLFQKQKKWMSVAAAAVLVLCCIPALQAQYGNDITQGNHQNVSYSVVQPMESNEAVQTGATAANGTGDDAVEQSAPVLQRSVQSTVQNEETKQSAKQQVSEQQVDRTDTDTASWEAEQNDNEQTPMLRAASANDGITVYSETADEGAKEEQLSDNGDLLQEKAAAYQQALQDLQQNLDDAQAELEETQVKLQQEPDNEALQKQAEDLQDNIDTLQKEIKQLQWLLEEVEAEIAE